VILLENIVFLLEFVSSSTWSKKYRKIANSYLACNYLEDLEARNGVIFSAKISKIEDIIDTIKFISWRLFLVRKNGRPFLYFEWFSNLLFCLAS
jgi:hypothetical protein